MAEKKTNKTASSTKKSGASNKKTNKPASNVKRVGKEKNRQTTFYERNSNAVMLGYIVVTLLLVFVAIIPGYNLWQKFRSGLLAVFGVGFFLAVIELVIISVRLCLKNLRRSLLVTNISAVFLLGTFCGILHLISFDVDNGGFEEWKIQFIDACKNGWDVGMGYFNLSGGMLGAVFGGVPLFAFGKKGSLVLLLLLFAVSLVLYLNSDINAIGDKISELAVRSKEKVDDTNAQRKERSVERKKEKQAEKEAKKQLELERREAEALRIAEAEEQTEEVEDEETDKDEDSYTFPVAFAANAQEETPAEASAPVIKSDAFDFDSTEIEYDPINKDNVTFANPKKHTFPQNGVFTYPDSFAPAKSDNEAAGEQTPSSPRSTAFGEDLISFGRGPVKSTKAPAEPMTEVYEEIDVPDDENGLYDLSDEESAVAGKVKPEETISERDKAVVSEAVKDAETKIEKSKTAVKNYTEPRKPKKTYKLPSIEFLNRPTFSADFDSEAEMRATAKKLVDVLKSFGVETTLIGASRGPSVTRYELSPAPGVKISRITSLADDIALGLASTDVRIEAPIPNKSAVGIEVPNKKSSMVTLREIISSDEYKESQEKLLTVALGKDIAGNIRCTDLAKMPHLLIAGTTGSGKSVCLNCMIASVLYNATPDQVKLLMIDPKQVEFSVYNGIPHLLVPVITDARKAAGSLAWAVGEMDSRYKSFSTCGVRDIKSYNNYIKDHPELPFMPQVVIFIDELNDLMMVSPKEVEDSICRLAQKARAAGMHLVVATQRPSVDVITGIIKANIPSRLSLAVSSQVDSRTILDSVGAEKLLGNGDMLFNPVGVSKPVRIQGAYLSDGEIEKIVTFIKNQGTVSYDDEIMQEIERNATADKKKGGSASSGADGEDSQLDALIEDAMNIVTELNSASTTVIQRKLSVGYARAARIMDQLEQLGYVSPAEGNKPRRVLITRAQFLEMKAGSGADTSDDYDVLSD